MHVVTHDFNGAGEILGGRRAEEWAELAGILGRMPLYLFASGEARRAGVPIFDPKPTNAFLTNESAALGWRKVTLTGGMRAFGIACDAGKNGVLAEWQFSNYPFVMNNVARTEVAIRGVVALEPAGVPECLIIVARSLLIPAANSVLTLENVRDQLHATVGQNIFQAPVRAVGLSLADDVHEVEATWSAYAGQRQRTPTAQEVRRFGIRRNGVNNAVTLDRIDD